MSEIEQLYGVEVILHFEAISSEQVVNGLIQPKKTPDWLEATVIKTGIECKKELSTGDKVIVAKTFYNEAPLIPKYQFDLPVMPNGEFKVLTEHLILMKIKSKNTTIDSTPVSSNQEAFDTMISGTVEIIKDKE